MFTVKITSSLVASSGSANITGEELDTNLASKRAKHKENIFSNSFTHKEYPAFLLPVYKIVC